MLPHSSDSSAPNFALDPQGLRGTASARRLQQTRRRKRWQTISLILLLALGVAAALWFGLQPRATGFAVQSAQKVPLDLSAPATLDAADDLWLTGASGALWKIDANGQSQRFGVAGKAGAPPLVGTGGGVYLPALDGTLTAFIAPEKTLWARDLGAALVTTPALWRDKNFPILGAGDSNGFVIALDANDGKTRWKTKLGGPIGNALIATRDAFLAPTLASGVWRGGLVCLDARTGRVRWNYSTDSDSAAGAAPPLFDAATERVYWNNDEGEIACLDARTGRIWWRHQLAPDAPTSVILRAAPVAIGENLIVGGNDGVLRALNANDGKARWTTELNAPIRAFYATKSGEKSAILATTDREILLIDAATGAVGERDAGVMAWPTFDGKSAIVVGESGSWRRVRW